jgi:hypothetical protein
LLALTLAVPLRFGTAFFATFFTAMAAIVSSRAAGPIRRR